MSPQLLIAIAGAAVGLFVGFFMAPILSGMACELSSWPVIGWLGKPLCSYFNSLEDQTPCQGDWDACAQRGFEYIRTDDLPGSPFRNVVYRRIAST